MTARCVVAWRGRNGTKSPRSFVPSSTRDCARWATNPAKWKIGYNPVSRLLGKELTLLAWAIEDADPTLIPTAIANWQGLSPEERWWLYTMTAAATGNAVTGRNRGWRKAVRFALTENPVSAYASDKPQVPEFFRLVSEAAENEKIEPLSERHELKYRREARRRREGNAQA